MEWTIETGPHGTMLRSDDEELDATLYVGGEATPFR